MTTIIRFGFNVESSLTSESKIALHLSEPILIALTILAVILTLGVAHLTMCLLRIYLERKANLSTLLPATPAQFIQLDYTGSV